MNASLKLPSGATVRTQSKRRFVLIHHDIPLRRAEVLKRSDSEATLRTAAARRPFHPEVQLFLADTLTGTMVQIAGLSSPTA